MKGIAALTLTLVALATPCSADEAPVIRGQALYRERMALPRDAVVEITLEDVSRADGTADVLGTVRLERAGQVPLRFEIPYDPARIDERRAYAVRARVLRGDRLLFTSDRVYPVLTRGHGSEVELELVRAHAAAPPEATVTLEDTHWILVELDGKAVPAGLPQAPHLVFRAGPRRVSGSGGCNRLTGEYDRDGERLRVNPLASTRRACVTGMDTEVSVHAALAKVRAFRVLGRRLELADDTGRILAALEAAGTRR